MRTTDLFGKSLTEYRRALARLSFTAGWDVRLKDQDGKVWTIPPRAVLGRSRGSQVDSGTWECSIEVDKAQLPKGVVPDQYHTLEVDRLMAGVWPYFRGQIDKVVEGVKLEEGSAVTTLTLQANGVLQRTKGYRVDRLAYEPTVAPGARKLMGIASTQVVSSSAPIPAPQTLTGAFSPSDTTIKVASTAGYSKGMRLFVYRGTSPSAIVFDEFVQVTAVLSSTELACTAPAFTFAAGDKVCPCEAVPGGGNVFVTSEFKGFYALVASPSATFASIYGLLTDYQAAVEAGGLYAVWFTTPATPRHYRFARMERYVSPIFNTVPRQAAFQLPPGRDINDLYQTTITSIDVATKTIGLADPTPLKTDGTVGSIKVTAQGSGYTSAPAVTFSAPPPGGTTATGTAILMSGKVIAVILTSCGAGYVTPPTITITGGGGTGAAAKAYLKCALDLAQGEYVTFTPSTGPAAGLDVPDYPIESIDHAAGTIKLTALYGYVQVGDPIRIGTTEYHQAWTDDTLITYCEDPGLTSPFDQRHFQTLASIGQAVPLRGGGWFEEQPVYAYVGEIYDYEAGTGNPRPNRVEEMLREILVAKLGLYDAGEVVTAQTGVLTKNFRAHATDLSELLRGVKEKSLGPADYIHDTPDGKLYIGPFRQKSAPYWEIRGVTSIEEGDRPEPVTAVTIIADGEPANNAATVLSEFKNLDNPGVIYDGASDEAAVPVDPFEDASVTLRFPRLTPLQAYPHVKGIKITGIGVLSVYLKGASKDYYLPGWTYRAIGSYEDGDTSRPKPETVEIQEDDLLRLFDRAAVDAGPVDVVLLWHSTSGSAGIDTRINEIQVLTVNHNAWRAELTDDTTKAIADQGAEAFGTIWTQPDPALKVSYRYAPTSYLKRVQPRYVSPSNQVPRHEVRKLPAISAQDCRNYAENYVSEYLRLGKTYTVEGPLLDFAELGDTVRVWWPDGSCRDLLLWGISDSGGALDDQATYTLVDYSL